jgi:UDP-glucose 4-epimerase
MNAANVKKIIFSSSATVYGESHTPPYKESFGRGTTNNPYGTSKAMIEQILEDMVASDPSWCVSMLRYFNPVGAHPSGKLGEDPKGLPNNLMPFITQVAVGARKELSIFGSDYDTPDGTCQRDFIHVMDLAEGHLAALQSLQSGCNAFNLGTGVPISVLEMVKAFETENQLELPHKVVARRAGDIAAVWADTAKAKTDLNWQAKRDLREMVRSSWSWQFNNPKGYV